MGLAYLTQPIPGINEPERETDQTFLAIAEIMNAWSFISIFSAFRKGTFTKSFLRNLYLFTSLWPSFRYLQSPVL
jgi:hypothetical protein